MRMYALLGLHSRGSSEIVWQIVRDIQTLDCSLSHSLRAGMTPNLFPVKDESAFFAQRHQNSFRCVCDRYGAG